VDGWLATTGIEVKQRFDGDAGEATAILHPGLAASRAPEKKDGE
jgi:hypothetical protein